MNYVKSCLIITMLLGGLYANCAFYPDDVGNDAGAGQYCGACCSTPGGDVVLPSGSEATCETAGGTWNGAELCPDSDCNESNWQEYYPEMQYCYLQFANLSGANLSYANLAETSLYMADLSNTDCYATFFGGAYLAGTNFDGADLTYATFDQTGDCIGESHNVFCDGYDDASYDAGAESGDANHDGQLNVLDIVLYANDILNP